MPAPVRVALIGANWGLTHVKAWQAVPGAEIVAICTARRETAEAAAAAHGIARPCWDWRELVEDPAIDIIDVTVRPIIRVPIAFAALAHRRHLLQPMPFALDLAQGRQLHNAAAGAGVVAMIESLHRHAPAFRQMKAMLDRGEIGQVHNVRGHVRTNILFAPPPGYVYEWITKAESGASALRNFGAHLLHTLRWMFGPVEEVVARLGVNMPHLLFTDGSRTVNETADTASVMMRLASGVEAAIDISWCTPGSEGFGLDAVGDHGRMTVAADGLGPQNAVLRMAQGGGKLEPVAMEAAFEAIEGAPDVRPSKDGRLLPLTAMCHRMARAVRGETEPGAAPLFDEGFEIMRTIEAAYRSHETRTWVNVAGLGIGG